jgi:phage I-like protein
MADQDYATVGGVRNRNSKIETRNSDSEFRILDSEGSNRQSSIVNRQFLTNIFSRDLRLELSAAITRDGKELYQIPVCVTGTWHKGSRKFSITPETLDAMARNFAKRKNDMIVIDYEHASEMPEVARGGPVPAAGWIHELTIDDFRLPIGGGKSSIDNRQSAILGALVEWTSEAQQMIRTGQYRFFSPAIDWEAKDKETGEPQGPTMTSGALTNHPFLEELPAITLSDLDVARTAVCATSYFADTPNQYLDQPAGARHGVPLQHGGNMADAKEVSMKKITDGEHAGHHHIFAGDDMVGCMSEEALAQHAAKHFSDLLEHDAFKNAARKHFGEGKETNGEIVRGVYREPLRSAQGDSQMNGESAQDDMLTEIGVKEISEAKRLIDLGRATEAVELAGKSRQALLSEAVKDGKIDNRKAEQLARANKITFADYIAAQEAERALEEAVRAGKILPRERGFFFRDALERPDEFSELVKAMPARVNLSTVGLGSAEAVSVDEEVATEAKRVMSEKKLGYSAALKEVLRTNPHLAEQYRKEHSRQIGGEAAN